MLIVRKDQITVFDNVIVKQFEDGMVVHLKTFAAKHCDVIGEEKVRETIRLGIERAKNYELTNCGPVRFFIELMFMFGSEFDTDPQYTWAADILNDPDLPDQMAKADCLHAKMTDYLEKVAGPENVYAILALRKTRLRVDQPMSFSAESFGEELLLEMYKIYPEKAKYTGDMNLRSLIQEGMQSAKADSVKLTRGVMLYVMLMYAIGHGFANDPLFPWISRTMQDPLLTDADMRTDRIERKAVTYLDNVLKYHGQG